MSTPTPIRIAATDEGEAAAIQRAMKLGLPLYFLNHVNGSTIDVSTDKGKMLQMKQEYISSTPDGRFKIRLYERLHTQLRPI